jgi:hypothetical protein
MSETLYVGVDMGTTHTGVAYAASGDKAIRAISRWPGTNAKQSKVPTRLFYCDDVLVGWGFDDPEIDGNSFVRGQRVTVVEKFKLEIDSSHTSNVGRTHDDIIRPSKVSKWYTDFLNSLYEHVCHELKGIYPKSWAECNIEFSFSIPNQYGPHVIARYNELIQSTGFGLGRHHVSSVNMTESQAAVVWAAQRLDFFRVTRTSPEIRAKRH